MYKSVLYREETNCSIRKIQLYVIVVQVLHNAMLSTAYWIIRPVFSIIRCLPIFISLIMLIWTYMVTSYMEIKFTCTHLIWLNSSLSPFSSLRKYIAQLRRLIMLLFLKDTSATVELMSLSVLKVSEKK